MDLFRQVNIKFERVISPPAIVFQSVYEMRRPKHTSNLNIFISLLWGCYFHDKIIISKMIYAPFL